MHSVSCGLQCFGAESAPLIELLLRKPLLIDGREVFILMKGRLMRPSRRSFPLRVSCRRLCLMNPHAHSVLVGGELLIYVRVASPEGRGFAECVSRLRSIHGFKGYAA